MNLAKLIKNAVDHGACQRVINKLKQYKTFEKAIQDINAPYYAYWYAKNVIKGRWEEGESIILMSPRYSCFYAYFVIKERWEKAEPIIFNDAFYRQQYCYYFNIILNSELT